MTDPEIPTCPCAECKGVEPMLFRSDRGTYRCAAKVRAAKAKHRQALAAKRQADERAERAQRAEILRRRKERFAEHLAENIRRSTEARRRREEEARAAELQEAQA